MVDIVKKRLIEEIIAQSFGEKSPPIEIINVAGDSINESCLLTINKEQKYFCKFNTNGQLSGLFAKEQQGLALLASSRTFRTPRVLECRESGENQILMLEWIDQGTRTRRFWEQLGLQLAALHQHTWLNPTGHSVFGLSEDNFMGEMKQTNTPCLHWIEFFIRQRLVPQIALAVKNRLISQKEEAGFSKVFSKLPEIFSDEPSSLLHGDLWSGNFLCDTRSEPVLIDPAVYYGSRCIDLGMTGLFGGFDKRFYESYQYYFPLPSQFKEQCEVCNLYPLLIHLNLFGKSYLQNIVRTINRF